ncbi:MAG: hypothetical protein GXO83_13535 [Chlorobi bacterium]|nr:hypothetical protein [Chlorobiota bacterium]
MIVTKKTAKECIREIKTEKILTWFDLGLFLDKLREDNNFPAFQYNGNKKDFYRDLSDKEIAFMTFGFSVDGVTNEIIKYIQSFEILLDNPKIHLIGGEFKADAQKILNQNLKKYVIEEAKGFDDWSLYKLFFYTKLDRGSTTYNRLIKQFWKETQIIAEKLANYIEKNNIGLLYIVNIASNPGNVSLALATVLVTEIMGIPVINNNHDFYWEGGSHPVDLKLNRKKPGPRDFFFTNAHLGEVFSIIEVLYPWDSRSWITVNINSKQTEHIIKKNGHNPANVYELGTSIDIDKYTSVSKREKINTFYQFEKILSRYKNILVSYSVGDVIRRKLVEEKNPRPILIGFGKTKPIKNFMAENVIFLQPTRIIARKRIETGFRLISQMFRNKEFTEKFKETGNLKITIIVTGPIASGHYSYYLKLVERFQLLLESLKPMYRSKVFLAFLFSELDKEKFKKRFKNPVGIPELYNISSLILLPSETEGRGLPIIEAAATGKPMFCRRYYPENVYSEVIGENLPEELRLKVIEYNGKKISKNQVIKIIHRVFFPHMFIEEIQHNQKVVLARYSPKSLTENISILLDAVYSQTKNNTASMTMMKKTMKRYNSCFEYQNKNFKELVKTGNREYLPGYNRLRFMIYLKSLIDPSTFRKEEQEMEGMAHSFAMELLERNWEHNKIEPGKRNEFYNAVDNIFRLRKGELKIRHDHSMAYRHRNKNYYPYRDYTFQELTGLINMLYREIIKPEFEEEINKNAHFFTDWKLSLAQLTCSDYLAIDNRDVLMKKMKENIPLIIFPGSQVLYALEFFALQAMRARIGLPLEQEMKEVHLKKIKHELSPIYIFLQKNPVKKWVSTKALENYIKSGYDRELFILYKNNLLHFINTTQWTVGIHLAQLGERALEVMKEVKDQNGFLITDRMNAAVMTDIADIDRVHIGKAGNPLIANILGIPEESGFIQFVPAGIRPTIAYPTPIQTAVDFDRLIHSDTYNKLIEEHGEEKILQILKKDAEDNGSPLAFVIDKLNNAQTKRAERVNVEYKFISGRYIDGNPWNGVIARTNKPPKNKRWEYKTLHSNIGTKKVTDFIDEYEKTNPDKVQIAWNGGYILNPELVGKLGLPESYIGSPLGMLVNNYKVISPPLFNKPALVVHHDGTPEIKRVNIDKGFKLLNGEKEILFTAENHNKIKKNNQPAYYDLRYDKEHIVGNGRIIVRLAGNTVKEVIHTKENEKIKIIPVGVTLSFPENTFPGYIKKGTKLEFHLNEYDDILHAVEAGPMLICKGEICIDMKAEGWESTNSIRTQAARLDFTDMRGPKIAVGIDREGNLLVLAINGRIRESVGATHFDMAEILLKQGALSAMGFDPGGSSTLVVNKKVLNISPYNHRYEENIYSLPPEPRAVANAVIGIIV